MNFKIESSAPQPEPIRYPVLMHAKGSSMVVLFTDVNYGHRLTSDGFGPLEGGWFAATDTKHWQPFNGTITVSA